MNHKSKRIINILLVICILITSFVGSAYATRFVFSDSVGHWAEDAINNLARKGVIHGYPDGLSHPDEIITRGEFSALLARIIELEPKETNTVNIVFEDIAGHFAQKEIEALINASIIIKEEYGTKYFPDEPITRMEIIKMLVRAIGKEEHNMDCACNTGFTDEDDLTEEEREYICAGKHYNIISGYPDGTIRPDGEATRGEAFEILDRHDEIKEIIEQEEVTDKIEEDVVDSPDVESDDKPSNNGSPSTGGSSYVPAPKYDYTLPNTAYVGEEIKITPNSSNVKSVTWIVTKNGIPTEISSVLDGELKAEGGVIKIKSAGSYTFSATALNSRGRTVVSEQTVSIYPVISAQFSLPETAHTDITVAVDLVTENLGDNFLIWTIKKDGKEIDLETVITGELTGSGGLILFKTNGVYELSATITDELGKEVTVSDIITVYPLAEIKMELANITHTDKTITLKTETKNAEEMEIEWSLTQNGKEVNIEDFIEGNIQVGESIIRFKEKGVYNLTISLIDKTGRVFKETVAITVWLVDNTFGFQDWSTYVDGKLDNNGGTIQFKRAGIYELVARIIDDTGRVFLFEMGGKTEVIIPCLLILPLIAPILMFLSIIIYFKEIRKADEILKIKKEKIEIELPRFVATITQELKASRDVLSILENFKKNSGEDFTDELDILTADMRSSSYEAALTRFEARINSPMLSDITRGLIGVLRGDDGSMYFQMLFHDMKQLELQRLKARAMKIPPKIRVFSFVMLMCFLMTYMAIIVYEIIRSFSGMF